MADTMTPGDRFGKLTIIHAGPISVRLVCDCGKEVVRARKSVIWAKSKGAEMQCKPCLRALIKEKYPAPAVSLVGAFNGLERMLR
jgi:hypothetical protein